MPGETLVFGLRDVFWNHELVFGLILGFHKVEGKRLFGFYEVRPGKK